MISNKIIQKAKDLMLTQTKLNGAPAWPLTEIAVKKGRDLAKRHSAREDLVVTALYLAHTIFSTEINGPIQQKHRLLSADFADNFLKEQGVSSDDREVIQNAILAHHGHIPTEFLESEVMKNAEGFKFLSLEGAHIFLEDLQARGLTLEQAKKEVIRKMNQKFEYLTLPDCIDEAKRNMTVIKELIK